MKAKLGTAFICLIVILVFGGTGVFAVWAMGTMVYDGMKARDWVLVKADVVNPSSYRYRFEGRDYESGRLGISRVGGEDNIDDWHPRMRSLMEHALNERRPITVYVNPADPSQAVIDREVRWKLLAFLAPFALAFGGVGLGALWFLPRIFRAPAEDPVAPRIPAPLARGVASDARGGIAGTWIFAFFWNAISLPMAVLFLPDVIASGDWWGLLVLIFPIIGVFMLVYAIKSTVGYLLRGRAVLEVLTAKARVGAPLQGSIAFSRGVAVGDAFRVKLKCVETDRRGDETSSSTVWTHESAVQAIQGPRGARVDFRFDVPSSAPATSAVADAPVSNAWRVEVQPASQRFALPYGFDVALAAAPAETEEEFTFANDAPVPPEVQQMFERLGVNATEGKKRAAFAELPPDQQAALVKFARWVPSMKTVGIVVVGVVAVIQFGPVLVDLVRLVR